MSRLSDKRAVITGTGQGIGLAAALLFAAEGARVGALDRNGEVLASLTAAEMHVIASPPEARSRYFALLRAGSASV